jgi:hypothetical protein
MQGAAVVMPAAPCLFVFREILLKSGAARGHCARRGRMNSRKAKAVGVVPDDFRSKPAFD